MSRTAAQWYVSSASFPPVTPLLMKALDLYQTGLKRLQAAAIDDAELDTALILGHLLGLSRAEVFLQQGEVADEIRQRFDQAVSRRLQREPLAYILGEQEFWSLPFYVNRDVLIPRPETEVLLETVLRILRDEGREPFSGRVLDLGTGSGVLAIVLALELPHAMVSSVDISRAAQLVAKENAKRHGVLHRISFITSDWLNAICPKPLFELLVANPPYVARESFTGLQPEVSNFEPRLALDGGPGGMEAMGRFAGQLASRLQPGGHFFMEIGADQPWLVMELFSSFPEFTSLKVYNDYAGLPRIVHARRL